MKKLLIINADDFGLHKGINEGILEAVKNGIVGSVSCVANRRDIRDSLKGLIGYPDISIGIHLNISDGEPISYKTNLDFLLDQKGKFKGSHYKTIFSVLSCRDSARRIKEEFKEQIENLLDSGVCLTHIDSHGHVHMLPCLFKVTAELAKKYRIPFIRGPRKSISFPRNIFNPKRLLLSACSKLNIGSVDKNGLICVDHLFGLGARGEMKQRRLSFLIASFREGVSELIVHPGLQEAIIARELKWGYDWENELAVLTDERVKEQLKRNGIILSSFNRIKR